MILFYKTWNEEILKDLNLGMESLNQVWVMKLSYIKKKVKNIQVSELGSKIQIKILSDLFFHTIS